MKTVQREPSCSTWTDGPIHRYDETYVHFLQFYDCAHCVIAQAG